MSHAKRRWLFGFLLAAAPACSSAPPLPATGNGELHQGTFVYSCTSSADPKCGTTALPAGIAVDADFELRFEPTDSQPSTLEPNASFFTAPAPGRLHTTRAGYGVVLVTNPSGEVIDFVNLRMTTIASLAIEGVDATAPLAVGETRTISASAFDAAGEPLAGTLSLEWESSDNGVATVTVTDPDKPLGTATLHAEAAGAVMIRVVAGAATGVVQIGVK